MTIKEQLQLELLNSQKDDRLTLIAPGEEMSIIYEQHDIALVINNYFDDNLIGRFPGMSEDIQIMGWYFTEEPFNEIELFSLKK